MSELIKYKLTFPVQKVDIAEVYPYPPIKEEGDKMIIPAPYQIRVNDDDLTFSIGNIKTRNSPAVIYFKFYGFDYHKNLIAEYTSDRMVVTTEYQQLAQTFTVPYEGTPSPTAAYSDLDHFYIEIFMFGVDSENPIYFNHLQLNQGELLDYHKPNDMKPNVSVGFYRNSSINLYDDSEIFLQVIRPNKEDITTESLTKSQMTILAPHLPYESTFDDPVNLFYEFMCMTEQRIGVEK